MKMKNQNKYREILEEYSKFLEDCGYLDDDWRFESPKAIDRFLAEKFVKG